LLDDDDDDESTPLKGVLPRKTSGKEKSKDQYVPFRPFRWNKQKDHSADESRVDDVYEALEAFDLENLAIAAEAMTGPEAEKLNRVLDELQKLKSALPNPEEDKNFQQKVAALLQSLHNMISKDVRIPDRFNRMGNRNFGPSGQGNFQAGGPGGGFNRSYQRDFVAGSRDAPDSIRHPAARSDYNSNDRSIFATCPLCPGQKDHVLRTCPKQNLSAHAMEVIMKFADLSADLLYVTVAPAKGRKNEQPQHDDVDADPDRVIEDVKIEDICIGGFKEVLNETLTSYRGEERQQFENFKSLNPPKEEKDFRVASSSVQDHLWRQQLQQGPPL